MSKLLISVLVGTFLSLLVPTQGDEISEVKNQILLYQKLHQFAFPEANPDADLPISKRFILQIPGKVLNPLDYDPGAAYKEARLNPEDATREVNIPPRVQESMHYLADAIPSLNPFSGGDTSASFSRMYKSVLNTLDVKGLDKQTKEIQDRYKTAYDTLTESRFDPEPQGLSTDTILLELYTRYQTRYLEARKRTEDEIESQRQSLTLIDYQLWFQRNYPILNREVENAYTKWLLYGEKDLVETYKAHLDVVSSGAELQEARETLRGAGVISLDRSTTIYPVSFIPSNFYDYLIPNHQPLTRDQLETRIGDLKAKIAMLNSLHGIDRTTSDYTVYLEELENDTISANTEVGKKTTDLEEKRLECRKAQDENRRAQSSFGGGTSTKEDPPAECAELSTLQSDLVQALEESAAATTASSAAQNEYAADSLLNSQISGIVTRLEDQVAQYENQLVTAPGSVPDYVLEANGTRELTPAELDDQWTQFSFDSKSSSTNASSEAKSYKAALSFGASGGLWSVSGSASYSRSQSEFSQSVASSDVKIDCKLLRVEIKRPWFRPELFYNNDLISRKDRVYVSPGHLTEQQFLDAVNSSTTTYLLPQFTTAFLLAKDVSLEFSSMTSELRSSSLKESAAASVSGRYGPFRASASFSYGHQKSNMQASTTADGLRITIPGAQIIGYYVEIPRKFPSDQVI